MAPVTTVTEVCRSVLVMVTVAPGTEAPVESSTDPAMLP